MTTASEERKTTVPRRKKLPLLLMYEKREEIGGFVTERSSDFAHWYWSRTEHPGHSSLVYSVNFTDGVIDWNSKGNFKLSVRLVRAVE